MLPGTSDEQERREAFADYEEWSSMLHSYEPPDYERLPAPDDEPLVEDVNPVI